MRLIARASSLRGAEDAASYFVGQALDVLALRINLPMKIGVEIPSRPHNQPTPTRRIISQGMWEEAFTLGRQYSLNRPVFSRALSWYRKGLIGENPIDELLSYWLSIETIAEKYHTIIRQPRIGMDKKVISLFKILWGNSESWEVIPNQPEIVTQFKNDRNDIAHGNIKVDINQLRRFMDVLPLYQDIAYAFVCTWEEAGIMIEQRLIDNIAEE